MLKMNTFQAVLFIVGSKQYGTVVKRQDVISTLEEFKNVGTINNFSLRYVDKILLMLRTTGHLVPTIPIGTYLRGTESVENLTLSQLEKMYTKILKL